jgi:hypothetical protein
MVDDLGVCTAGISQGVGQDWHAVAGISQGVGQDWHAVEGPLLIDPSAIFTAARSLAASQIGWMATGWKGLPKMSCQAAAPSHIRLGDLPIGQSLGEFDDLATVRGVVEEWQPLPRQRRQAPPPVPSPSRKNRPGSVSSAAVQPSRIL